MDSTTLKAQIDAAITNETAPGGISPSDVGTNIKSVVDYVDQQTPVSFYVANLTQSSTSAPSGTEKKTFAGNLTWSYSSVGTYLLTSSVSLSGFICIPLITNSAFPLTNFTLVRIGDAFRLRTYDMTGGTATLTDGALSSFSMKIEFYLP